MTPDMTQPKLYMQPSSTSPVLDHPCDEDSAPSPPARAPAHATTDAEAAQAAAAEDFAPDSVQRLQDLWTDHVHSSGKEELHRRTRLDGVYAPCYFTGTRGVPAEAERKLAGVRRRRPAVGLVDFPPTHSLLPVGPDNQPALARLVQPFQELQSALDRYAQPSHSPPPAAAIHAYNQAALKYREAMTAAANSLVEQLS